MSFSLAVTAFESRNLHHDAHTMFLTVFSFSLQYFIRSDSFVRESSREQLLLNEVHLVVSS